MRLPVQIRASARVPFRNTQARIRNERDRSVILQERTDATRSIVAGVGVLSLLAALSFTTEMLQAQKSDVDLPSAAPQRPFPPEHGRLRVKGRQFYDADNRVWRWRGTSQFLLFARYLERLRHHAGARLAGATRLQRRPCVRPGPCRVRGRSPRHAELPAAVRAPRLRRQTACLFFAPGRPRPARRVRPADLSGTTLL